jgi:integrase
MHRGRIDRKITVARLDATPLVVSGSVAIFVDGRGEVVQRFDLDLLGLPVDLTDLLARAFRAVDVGQTEATRGARWAALRGFARFVQSDNAIKGAGDLTTAAFGRYADWLGRQRTAKGHAWSEATRSVQFAMMRALLLWIQRSGHVGLADLDMLHSPFFERSAERKPRRRVPEAQLKAILRVCYEEIDEAWSRFTAGQAIISSPNLPAKVAHGDGFNRWLWRIHRGFDGIVPTGAQLKCKGMCAATLNRYGGLLAVAQHMHLTTETLVPFYIAILIQTAGNPDAVRVIRRNCLIAHPLDEHSVVIVWDKPRAAGHAQRRAFDTRRAHAAPNLIEKLLAMTAPLVPHARAADRENLFLLNTGSPTKRRRRNGTVGVIDASTLKRKIPWFIARANKRIAAWNAANPQAAPRPRIECFAPAFLRGSVATEHYKASGGDIVVTQTLLNHASASTTETYIKGEETRRLQAQTIARLQQLMLAWIDARENSPPHEPYHRRSGQRRAIKPFAHDCLAPLLDDGQLCPYFGGCLACPGLVIPLDAEHLARILQAKRHLEAARERLDPHRWNLIYAPTYRALTGDILPDFPQALYERAVGLAQGLPPLADLE